MTDNTWVLEMIRDRDCRTDAERDVMNMAINSVKAEQADKFVHRETLEQIMWERDIAIEQLKELGYGFGEKIRQADEFIPMSVIEDIRQEILENRNWHFNHGQEDMAMLLDLDALDVIDNHISGKEQ